jgi:hypothetical protein
VAAACPVPETLTVVGEFVALLVTLTLAPVTAPAVVGSNVTVSVAVCPGVRIVPLVTPLALNPAPVVVSPEIVTLEFPVFVSVEVCDVDVFTVCVPKLKLVGFAVSVAVAATPVPVKLMVICDGVPFVVNCTDPVTAPAPVGANTALNAKLPPAAIVDDVVSPLMLIPAPATVMFENVRVALPLFRSVICWEFEFPTITLEKLALVGEADT